MAAYSFSYSQRIATKPENASAYSVTAVDLAAAAWG